ncbi:MAG: hypothetical protein FWC16_10285 [Defluviitaleaceae bacterium]|nr:hypothetical protein [Defluviitaleaceae bacterium]MCL2275304.1 hypothetical protein [Defluviitaleaceae bacterium]
MNEDKKPARGKKGQDPPAKGKGGLIVIIVLVLIIGGFMVILAFDLFGLREDVLMPYLRNAPLIGRLIPPAEEEDANVRLEDMTPQQLARMIRELQGENEYLRGVIEEYEAQRRSDALRIARLLPFHEYWVEYQRVSAEFNAMIARGDPEAFLHFIEYVHPEFWEQLARDAMQLHLHDESVRMVVGTLNNMQEGHAAAILEDLLRTDTPLLINVLNAMGNSLRGAILEQLEPNIAAIMVRFISVPEPNLVPLAPALFTPLLPDTYDELQPEEEYEEEPEPTPTPTPPPAYIPEDEDEEEYGDDEEDVDEYDEYDDVDDNGYEEEENDDEV